MHIEERVGAWRRLALQYPSSTRSNVLTLTNFD